MSVRRNITAVTRLLFVILAGSFRETLHKSPIHSQLT
jgi:hypothetical protein